MKIARSIGLLVLAVLLAGAAASAQGLVPSESVVLSKSAQALDGKWHSTRLTIRLERSGGDAQSWIAGGGASWLSFEPTGGTGPARIVLKVDGAKLPAAANTTVLHIVTGSAEQLITVKADAVPGHDLPPFGSFDAPPNSELVAVPTRLFGWALDDVGVEAVEICSVDTSSSSSSKCSDGVGAKIALGELEINHRPDVAAAFPGYPHIYKQGWTAVITLAPLEGRRRIYALARDAAGNTASLGEKTYTVRPAPPVAPALAGLLPMGWLLIAFGAFVGIHFAGAKLMPMVRSVAAIARPERSGARVELAALFLVIAGFMAVGVSMLSRSLVYDEMYSASQFIVGHSLWDAMTSVRAFNNHFGNSLAAGISIRVFGIHDWALRVPALLVASAGLVVTWRLTRRLAGPVAGLCAAALLALSPAYLQWAETARGYAGLACFTCLSGDAFFRTLRTGSRRDAWVHTIASALAPFFHLYGCWILAIQYAFFWIVRASRGRQAEDAAGLAGLRLLHRSFLIAAAVTVVWLLPSIGDLSALAAATGRTAINWKLPLQTASELLATTSPALLTALAIVVSVGASRIPRAEAAYCAAVILVPFFAMWLVARPYFLFGRFFSYCLPMVAMLMVVGAMHGVSWSWRARGFRRIAALPVTAIALFCIGGFVYGWIQADVTLASPRAAGYREWLARPFGWNNASSAAVGGDAFMFDYYLGGGTTYVADPETMASLLDRENRLLVAYHDMSWNAPADRAILAMLMRRCLDDRRGNVVMFQCR